jgi:RNA-directed DNA polymerase
MLCAKVKSHYAYYGITGNYRSLSCFVQEVTILWNFWLNRRGNAVAFTWG